MIQLLIRADHVIQLLIRASRDTSRSSVEALSGLYECARARQSFTAIIVIRYCHEPAAALLLFGGDSSVLVELRDNFSRFSSILILGMLGILMSILLY